MYQIRAGQTPVSIASAKFGPAILLNIGQMDHANNDIFERSGSQDDSDKGDSYLNGFSDDLDNLFKYPIRMEYRISVQIQFPKKEISENPACEIRPYLSRLKFRAFQECIRVIDLSVV